MTRPKILSCPRPLSGIGVSLPQSAIAGNLVAMPAARSGLRRQVSAGSKASRLTAVKRSLEPGIYRAEFMAADAGGNQSVVRSAEVALE
jgi:hypothetical protein